MRTAILSITQGEANTFNVEIQVGDRSAKVEFVHSDGGFRYPRGVEALRALFGYNPAANEAIIQALYAFVDGRTALPIELGDFYVARSVDG